VDDRQTVPTAAPAVFTGSLEPVVMLTRAEQEIQQKRSYTCPVRQRKRPAGVVGLWLRRGRMKKPPERVMDPGGSCFARRTQVSQPRPSRRGSFPSSTRRPSGLKRKDPPHCDLRRAPLGRRYGVAAIG
jgi:hypothetical protein